MNQEDLDSSLSSVSRVGPPCGPPLKQRLKDALVAFSLANLCLVGAWFGPLYSADEGYFNRLPVQLPTLLALAANLAWLTLLAWAIIRLRRRASSRWVRLGCDLLFFVALLLPADFWRAKAFQITDAQVMHFFMHPMVALVTLGLLAAVAWQHQPVAQVAAVLVGILSPLAFFTLARITLLALGLMHLAQFSGEVLLPAPGPISQGKPRVLWVLFDETDQRLAFEQRPPGLQLPEFDRLRAASLCATNAFSPGDNTALSIPGLISGRRVSKVTIVNDSDLAVTDANTGGVTNWSELPSVFSAARQLGVNTALVGWYHPYDRVLGRGLNFCEWHPHPGFESARGRSFSAAVTHQLACLSGTFFFRHLFANICRQSLAESLSVVTNSTYGLVFLHLPPPHKPGVYLPEKDQFTIFGMNKVTGYFNNLVLADRTLGKLRRPMESTDLWDQTWVILTSDHSWRESRLYDGKRDLRVPFLIKPPGAGTPSTYSPAINTALTHDFILALLRGEITNSQTVASWLDNHPF